jgi:purine-binding chemotaxis protein CheW
MKDQRSDALQQVLSQLQSAGRAGNGAYTPEHVADMARRAGISDPAQIAQLGRTLGVSGGATVASAAPQHVLFTLGDVECALPAEAVQGVERVSEITPVPNTAPWVRGVVQVWGAIVSAVDLQAFLGLSPQHLTSRSRLIVVTRPEITVGFLVNAVTEMRPLGDLSATRLEQRGIPPWAAPIASGMLQLEARSVVLLDPQRLLASDQLQRYQAG